MRSIRGRLLLMMLVGLAVVLVAGGASLYAVSRAGMLRQFDARLEAQARSVAALVSLEGRALTFDSDDADAAVPGALFELRDSTGAVLKRTPGLGDVGLPARELDEGTFAFEDVDLPGTTGRAALHAFRPRVDEDDDEGGAGGDDTLLALRVAPEVLLVTTAMDRAPVDRALGTLLGALGAVGGFAALTIVGLLLVGVRWGLRPLDRLSRRLGDVGAASLSARLDAGGAPAELVPVYRELNRMLDRVERTIERERTFADAAAHELRTPLAELRATAEVALRWPDGDRAETALRELLEVGREMERLVETLLLISRGHAGDDTHAGREVPVATLVPACLEGANGTIDERGLVLDVAVDANGAPRGPHDAVEIIVRNLLDNAIRYTPRHGGISIRHDPDPDGTATLVVENGPVALDPEDLPRLFEPFWQDDPARSDRAHVGLGLTVVERIARAAGLRVDARLAGDRLQMRIRSA